MSEHYDHIVVGGGSSGCVVAARLADEGRAKVLLLEAGFSHRHPLLDMPPGMFKMINGSKYMKYHKTTPQPQLDNRRHDIPQGHVLGGGSSVNAQVYMRGRPSDYDEWNEILRVNNDTAGWGWKDVLPYFRRVEDNHRLHNEFHGIGGQIQVSDPAHINEISRWFVQSVQAMGEPYTADFNGATQRGVGFYQFTNREGKRSSSAYAFLAPQSENRNLTIKLRATAQKVLIKSNKAAGVVYKTKDGVEHTALTAGEVILASGALVTPKLLMLSGIGPSQHLEEHGIDVLVDLVGVGRNLIDHPEVPMTAYANGPYGYYKQGNGWRMLKNGLQFKLFGSGPVTSVGFEAGAFINPADAEAAPTIQAFCVPVVYLDRGSQDKLVDDYGVTITTVVVKPKSRGEVKLASADPSAMPLVSPNLLSHEDDMRTMIAGQRFFISAMQSEPLKSNLDRIAIPSPDDLSDDALASHCKRFVKTNYHPAGTACMGADSNQFAVLDAKLRVRGVQGLRVCDMSAVPNINAGNTNAPAIMLGDRCAEFIMTESS
ncbi:MAG: GMC family oxidoreductase [bacterium]